MKSCESPSQVVRPSSVSLAHPTWSYPFTGCTGIRTAWMFNTLVPNVAHPSSYHPQLLKSSRQNASITGEPERLQARKRNQAGPMGQATTQITGRSQTTPHWSGKDSRTEADRKTENDYKRERASPSRESVPTKSHQHQACSGAREHNREGQKARPLQRPREKDPRRVGKACRTRATKYQACSDARERNGWGPKSQAASQAGLAAGEVLSPRAALALGTAVVSDFWGRLQSFVSLSVVPRAWDTVPFRHPFLARSQGGGVVLVLPDVDSPPSSP